MIRESSFLDERMLLIGKPILCLLVLAALRVERLIFSVHRPCVCLLVCGKLPSSANFVGSQTFQNQNVLQVKVRVQFTELDVMQHEAGKHSCLSLAHLII